MNIRVLAAATALALPMLSALPALADVSIDAIVANPAQYDGQHVDVTGTVKSVKQHTSHKGNQYETFDICAKQCVHVYAHGHPSVTNGTTVTVHGDFAADKQVGTFEVKNEIDAYDDGGIVTATPAP